jgi:hypothetical protein
VMKEGFAPYLDGSLEAMITAVGETDLVEALGPGGACRHSPSCVAPFSF